ncbi:hypothetical protein KY290_035875 [Solanum tuberosum]|uniref:Small EDRK-rich factor-like N-terminal domain-containing protein n=1 Tax=Solanum tuberosum TaxID=4113 RepID=A0ABQ7TRN7_SOLTU|nr:hypothetical protein KY284_035242 [Solanum tuberosum]KAH0737170.1 hypothetical protein KY290_035875 [Solanum tuberosum]
MFFPSSHSLFLSGIGFGRSGEGGDAVGSNANVKQKKIKAEQAMLAEKEKRRAEELAAIKAKKEHARKSGWKKNSAMSCTTATSYKYCYMTLKCWDIPLIDC